MCSSIKVASIWLEALGHDLSFKLGKTVVLIISCGSLQLLVFSGSGWRIVQKPCISAFLYYYILLYTPLHVCWLFNGETFSIFAMSHHVKPIPLSSLRTIAGILKKGFACPLLKVDGLPKSTALVLLRISTTCCHKCEWISPKHSQSSRNEDCCLSVLSAMWWMTERASSTSLNALAVMRYMALSRLAHIYLVN